MSGWVEMLVDCRCGVWCQNINRQVYERLKAEYQELRGLTSFFGNSVTECTANAIAAGWRRHPVSNGWQCPVCLAEQQKVAAKRNPYLP